MKNYLKKFLLLMFVSVFVFLIGCDSIVRPQEESDFSRQTSEPIQEESSVPSKAETEEWETTNVSDGKTVLRRFTKEYQGSKDDYTTTILVYVDSVFIEKSVIVFSNGKQSYKETERYQEGNVVYFQKVSYYSDESVKTESVYSVENDFVLTETYSYDTYGYIQNGTSKKEFINGVVHESEFGIVEFKNKECLIKSTIIYDENGELVYSFNLLKGIKSGFLEHIEYYDSESTLKYLISNDGETIQYELRGLGGFYGNNNENIRMFFDKENSVFAKVEINGSDFLIVASDNKYDTKTVENMVVDIWQKHVFYRDIIVDEFSDFFNKDEQNIKI